MGRKSKLTPAQWAEVERRLYEGESRRALAREFGLSETSIREHFADSDKEVRAAANKLVDAEVAIAALPPVAQETARNLAKRLRSISESLASAAELGAKTSHRMAALANSEAAKVDDAEPLNSEAQLKGVAVLTKLANDSASTALNLLSANRDAVKRINEEQPEEPETLTPDRLDEGVRRLAFLLNRTAQKGERHAHA